MSGLDLTIFRVINSDLSNAVFDRLMPAITRPAHRPGAVGRALGPDLSRIARQPGLRSPSGVPQTG